MYRGKGRVGGGGGIVEKTGTERVGGEEREAGENGSVSSSYAKVH